MDVQRTAVLLLVLLREAPCAEALQLDDPLFCYILDGILLVYSIIITALFFQAKLGTPNSKLENNSTYSELMTSGEQYDWLNRDIESGSRTRAHRPNDEVYTPLKPGAGDTYREIPAKNERRRNKNEMVYQDLSSATKDTPYDSLQMYPVGQRR
ncbi:T-cell surface glycoprotein CD3 zeta chain-like [Paramormyrops kingsleyae]|uniref:T-cell surface glycoprotein CD3 zeta chain-like n=1 Tax=Paramormyrops kingsleyae TaxID=1676925 RepID=UPI003B971776